MFTKKNFKKLLLAGAVLAGLQSVGVLAMNKKPALAHKINDVFARADFNEIKKFMEPADSMSWKTENDRNPLHVAAYLGLNEAIIKFLIEKANLTVGFDFEAVDKDGKTTIDLAVDQGHHAAAKQIIKAMFEIKPNGICDSNFCTVIDLIAIYGYTDVGDFVKKYAQNNPFKFDLKKCINRFNTIYRKSPFELAIKYNQPAVAKWLVENGSDLQRTDDDKFETTTIYFENLVCKQAETDKKFIEVAELIYSKLKLIAGGDGDNRLQELQKRIEKLKKGTTENVVDGDPEFQKVLYESIESAGKEQQNNNQKPYVADKKVASEESWVGPLVTKIFSMASTIFLGSVVGGMIAQKRVSKPLLFGGISALLLTRVAELATKKKNISLQEQFKATMPGKLLGFSLGVAVPVVATRLGFVKPIM